MHLTMCISFHQNITLCNSRTFTLKANLVMLHKHWKTDFVNYSNRFSLGCRESLTRRNVLQGCFQSGQSWKPLGTSSCRKNPEINFWKAKPKTINEASVK